MKQRQLGKTARSLRSVSAAWRFSGGYGTPDDAESIATVHAALDAGISYLDSGDFYGMGYNEMLLRDALKGRGGTRFHRDQVRASRARPTSSGTDTTLGRSRSGISSPTA